MYEMWLTKSSDDDKAKTKAGKVEEEVLGRKVEYYV
jgi:hypothetical protein